MMCMKGGIANKQQESEICLLLPAGNEYFYADKYTAEPDRKPIFLVRKQQNEESIGLFILLQFLSVLYSGVDKLLL